MTLTSQTNVTNLIAELINHTDLEEMSIASLEGLSTALFNVLATDYELLATVPDFSSYHQKLEELLAEVRRIEHANEATTSTGTKGVFNV